MTSPGRISGPVDAEEPSPAGCHGAVAALSCASCSGSAPLVRCPRGLRRSGVVTAGAGAAPVQVRLLGPFELVTPGGPQLLSRLGERSLLAVLALSAGRAVALPTLVEALWEPDHLPDDPVNAVQVRVSKLRRTLASLGVPDVVDRQGSAYRLRVEPDAVDVHAFRKGIETARRTGDPQQAVDLYDRSLELWRGEPLVDFIAAAWAGIESAQLTELRLAALGERAERLLTLGRYERVAADLEPVVAAAPTRERLVAQLMT